MSSKRVTLERSAKSIELLGLSEIADRMGRTKQDVYNMRTRSGFPAPHCTLRMGPVWIMTKSLDKYIRAHKRD